MQIHSEMEMISRRKAGFAGLADGLSLGDLVARFDIHRAQVRVQGKQPQTVIDQDRVAVNAEIADEGNGAAIGGLRGVVLGNRQVVAQVIGMIDDRVLIGIGSSVGKIRFDFGIAELAECVPPEDRRRHLHRDRSDFFVVLFSQIVIDFDKNLLRIPLARAHVVQQRRDFRRNKLIGNRDGALFVFHIFELVDESHFPRVAGLVGGHQHRPLIRRDVVRMREKGDPMIRVILDLAFVSGEKIAADFYARAGRIRRGFIHDHADAAEVHVAVIGDELDGGRGDIDGDVFLERGFVAAKKTPERAVARADSEHRGPFLEAGKL